MPPSLYDSTSTLGLYPFIHLILFHTAYSDHYHSKPSAESVRDWIARHTPGRPHPEVSRPTEWFKIITSVVTIVGGFSALVTVWPYIEPIVTNRKVVAFFCVGFILIHTSGHMFNSIRNVPYAGNDGKGRIAYFAGGFQSQYQLESQIIAALCMLPQLLRF